MQQLTANTYWLTDAVGAHCYWLDAGDRVAIVDPGMSPGLNRVARELRRAGRSPYEVTDILLTHADADHAQAAAQLQRRTGPRCWLGVADAAVLTGAAQPASAFRRFTVRFGRPELPRHLNLLDGDAEPWPGLAALHTPGHTPGHFSFVTGRVLFGGDTALMSGTGLEPMHPFLMTDVEQGLVDLARLSRLDVDWYCFGHSDPVRRR